MLTSPPPMTQFAQAMYDALAPIAVGDDRRGYPVAVICGAFGEMFREVEELVRAQPGREPWQQAFDINAAPAFLYPWLGQVVGVRDINGLSPADQKTKIVAESQFWRGSVGAMVNAVIPSLTGRQTVRVVESTPDADSLELITNTSETPDPTRTAQLAQAAKVAMLLLTVIQSDVPIIDEGTTRTIDAATATLDTAVLSDVT